MCSVQVYKDCGLRVHFQTVTVMIKCSRVNFVFSSFVNKMIVG